MSALHEALRPWATSPDTNRALRALYSADGAAAGAGAVFVVLLPGALAPESVQRWHEVNGRRVALVSSALALELAALRRPAAVARDLRGDPPPGGAWCLALGGSGQAHAWSTPLAFSAARATVRGDA